MGKFTTHAMPLCGCTCLPTNISKSRAIKVEVKHSPSQLSMNKQTGTFSTHSYSDIPCLQKTVTREQFTQFLTELNTRCAFIHQEILVNTELLQHDESSNQVMDCCVAIQVSCRKLQEAIERIIYAHDFAFLKHGLQVVNHVDYERLKEILSDPELTTHDIADVTLGALFQLYDDGIVIQRIPQAISNSTEGKQSFAV